MSSNFDVFLIYNRDDIPIVHRLANALLDRGIRAWIADDDIQPGTVRQAELEHAIETARTAAVLVGRDGVGPWEQQQIRAVLDQFVHSGLPIIPVLLPLAPKEPELPRFLKAFTWVDLRQGLNAEGLARLAWGITGERSPAAGGDRPPMVSISQLPSPGRHFVSREIELKRMDRAWEERRVNILSIVAPGGVGKSALVSRWLIAPAKLGAERIFCWSFYREVASVDRFLNAALRWFGDPEPSVGSAWDRGRRLADLVRQRRTILVLDGLEAQQHPPKPMRGQLKDEALKVLLKELAGFNRGLCIVTTRQPIFEIRHLKGFSVREIKLRALTQAAGAQLLHDLGVEGEKSELRLASKELAGHALTLSLLGSYLVQAYRGQIRSRDQVHLVEADQHFGGQAGQIMNAYEAWLEPRELAILRLIAFFDRPTEASAINALIARPVIPNLTEELASMDGRDWRIAGDTLRQCGLLYPRPRESRDDLALDPPPLVRAYYRHQLQHQQRLTAAWIEGNRRLYRHFQDAAPDLPATLVDMIPLYRSVVHGCRAGKQREALAEVYYRRIMRRDEHFSWKNLGCLGTELATLASFFDVPWDRPSSRLSKSEQGFVLSAAGMCMRILGRLSEAAEPIRASLELARELEHWDEAAFRSNNLCDLYLIRGELDRALASIEQSIELADRGQVPFVKAGTRLTQAHALHQMGRWQDSLSAFQAAEEIIQTERLHQDALLFLHKAFHYCDYLLGRVEVDLWPLDSMADPTSSGQTCQQAKEYAEQALATAEDRGWDREIALSHMFLGRALLDLELLATGIHGESRAGADDPRFEHASEHLDQAVERLRQGEQRTYVPRALLARAALYRTTAPDRAFADLTEAEKLASSQLLALHTCDLHLEWARLHADRRELELARERINLARKLAAAKGYHSRDQEIAAVQEAVR